MAALPDEPSDAVPSKMGSPQGTPGSGESRNSGPSAGQARRDAVDTYLAAGFSVIPVLAGDKQPNYGLLRTPDGERAKWQSYQSHRPTPILLAHWLREDPGTNLGIICGEISGNLVCLDVDSPDFAVWMERECITALMQTWVVRTGSGKLHVYLRSPKPLASTTIKDSFGTVLFEVRSEGQYVVAPPSLHPSGTPYVSLWGAPARVSRMPDILDVATRLRDRFETGRKTVTVTAGRTAGVVEAMTDDEKRELLTRLRTLKVPTRVRTALVVAPKAGQEAWTSCPSYSEVDWVICKELRFAGLGRLDLHRIYESFDIGLHTYRARPSKDETGGGSMGYAYLEAILDKVDVKLAERAKDALSAVGENFAIVKAIRYMGDPPSYEVTFHNTDPTIDEDATALLSYEDMQTEHKFRWAVLRQIPRLVPRFRAAHAGRNWPVFTEMLAKLSVLEAVPDDATQVGHLRAIIISVIGGHVIDQMVPATHANYNVGWRSSVQRMIYVRPRALQQHLSITMRQPPLPNTVWQILRGLGAIEKRIKLDNVSERLWVVPARSVDDR